MNKTGAEFSSTAKEGLLVRSHSTAYNREEKWKVLKKEEKMKQKEVSYVKYYKHWRDFDLLTCILAMVGLVLAIAEVRKFYDLKIYI